MIDCWLPEKCFKLNKKHYKTDFQLVTVHYLVSWTFFGFNVHLKVYEGVYSIWEILEPSFFFLNKVRGDT